MLYLEVTNNLSNSPYTEYLDNLDVLFCFEKTMCIENKYIVCMIVSCLRYYTFTQLCAEAFVKIDQSAR